MMGILVPRRHGAAALLLVPSNPQPPSAAAAPASPSVIAPGYPRLLADIGGTNARFAWLDRPGALPAHARSLPVDAHAEPAAAARAYLEALSSTLGAAYRAPRQAAFAVATAVSGDRVAFTNSRWDFSREAVRQALALERLVVLNDFEALALALPHLQPRQWRRHPAAPALQGLGTAAAQGTVLAVLGPGTGLGVGAVLRTSSGWQALPGEGGHATLAAGTELEAEVIAVVRQQHAHVSAERLLSGIGLPLLHAALGQVRGEPVHALDTETIVTAALQRHDALAGATLDLFCALLGSFAGNVVLTLGARGGCFIGGGIVPRFAERFFASEFLARFTAKGRFHDYLAAVPVVLITDTTAALAGAAWALDPPGQPDRASSGRD